MNDTVRDPFVIFKYVILGIVAFVVLVPLLATALGGFKSLPELQTNAFGLPQTWDTTAYRNILTTPRFWLYLWNSLVISVSAVIATIVLASMCAFAFAFTKFRGQKTLLNYFTLGLMFPAATAALPIFINIRDLGLLDTHLGVVLPNAAFGLAMSIILFRRFFKEIPDELREAALVDGASYFHFFVKIILPLSRPIIATVATIQFVHTWNSYILPLVLLNSETKYPWPLGIMQFQGEYLQEWNVILAFITLTLLPTIIVFLLCQKHIVSGLTSGSVKG
ncbi:carbohydrate ABC transporter permease [Rhizobium leguminosarum]|jgi:raffinose/stachyose/melibiose transport system permease protein|uniref:Carbohydrate ABC transporter permease n=1 Tax=Rhizobium leguminosarum TaxID=384 RepID=A0ABD7PJS6_RHILE|nr:carbohydrate ABC transporter permease [Rhizobium leguminosarum]TAV64621.1 carbohydrate ABC transporter permease [Rhizobium leguminosarum]TAV65080.1 carbohydrate ABC transporter permease [Rhizobium leguminosarum]TAW25069.1 carbohydrate ABC transporter permease [Rhizobium leguminosarum]TAW38841.1 carbohydrate ABC transporter permease [Rhizobium leguminosarum]TAY71655.1 carbohydrate ABC transporter permease [Rhizobium leguminosarum]